MHCCSAPVKACCLSRRSSDSRRDHGLFTVKRFPFHSLLLNSNDKDAVKLTECIKVNVKPQKGKRSHQYITVIMDRFRRCSLDYDYVTETEAFILSPINKTYLLFTENPNNYQIFIKPPSKESYCITLFKSPLSGRRKYVTGRWLQNRWQVDEEAGGRA